MPVTSVLLGDAETHGLLNRDADGQGKDEREGEDGERADDLAPELVDAAAVEQAVDTRRGLSGGEEADQDRAHEAADEVDADDVERVVVAEPELQAHGERAEHAGDGADEDRADRRDRRSRTA